MGSTRSHIDRASATIAMAATGASAWRRLDGVYTKFAMQSLRATTATTAFSMKLQGTISTASTTPTALVSIAVLTGAAVASTVSMPLTYVRVYSTSLSSGSVNNYIVALP